MTNFNRISRILLLALFVVGVAVVVSARLSETKWNGRSLASLSQGEVHADGWMEERASLPLGRFFPVGNYLELILNPWRPGGAPPAQLALSLCGAPEQLFSVTERVPVRFALRGCDPAQVTLRGLNTFTTTERNATRNLSVQIVSVEVSSSFGFAIPNPAWFATVALALGLLVACAVTAAGGVSRLGVAVGVIVSIAALVVVSIADVPAERFLPLWLACIAALGGMALNYLNGATSIVRDRTSSLSRASALVWLAPIVVVVIGAALRVNGLTFGLPANYHPDEVPKVNAVMRMVDQHTFNPQYFLHPSLLLYSTYFVNMLLHALGLVDGSFRDSAFLAGRIVSATAGTISIALTFEIGRRLLSYRAGLLGALLLAVFPLHVTCSRYLKEDALLTFLVLSCVLVTIISVQSKRRWLLLAAGLLAGMTAGTKYSGILMAVVPASAPWIVSRSWLPDRRWLLFAVLAVMIAPIGFVMTTPYAVLDSVKFLKDFEAESRHMQTGHTTSIDPWSQLWMYHFWRSIIPGVSDLVAVLGLVGIGFLIRRGRIEDLVVVGLFILFYLPAEYVKAKPAPQPERYIVPCLPFLALAVGELLFRLGKLRVTRGVAVLTSLAIVAVPLSRTLSLSSEVRDDTRAQMARWMTQNLPPGAKVLMDWKPYCPRFDAEEFNVEYIPRARIIPELDVRALKASGADYLVLSSLFYNRYFSQPESNPVLRQRIREVFERVPVVVQKAPQAGTYGFHNPVLTLFSLKHEDFTKLESELVMKREGRIGETSNEGRARAKW